MAFYDYIVISVPSGCTEYEVDQIIPQDVAEPPPPTLTIGTGVCAGTLLELATRRAQ
jgi:hypothetical protein